MSPLDIRTLLHIYSINEPFPTPSMAHSDTINRFVENDLVKIDMRNACGYKLTGRGEKLVEMLCGTPLPEYCNPRFPSSPQP